MYEPKPLHAYLYDPAVVNEEDFVRTVFSIWDNHEAANVIPNHIPEHLRDYAIVRCDPTTVTDSDGSTYERDVAIVETPQLAAVVLTSGTTGNPRPVELSYYAIESSTRALYSMLDLDSTHRWLCVLPPYYIAGLAIFGRCWSHSNPLVFHRKFDVMRIRETLSNKKIDVISVTAQQLNTLITEGVNLSHLHSVLVGGSSFSDDLREKCENADIPVRSTYGMTETFGGVCLDGYLLENTEARIENDEIQLRTTSLFTGYRHNEHATKQAMTNDGFFRTGDHGVLINNELTVLGRIDDLINSGGIKIDPFLVEKVFAYHFPDWEGFIAASNHPLLGQCTTLFVTETLADIKTVREQLAHTLPSTHLPVRIAQIKEFPVTLTGKVRRRVPEGEYTVLEEYTNV